jgi:hypothetical protein
MVSRDEVIHHYGTGDIATNLRLGDGRVEIREINMKADVLRLAAVILVATASAAHAASETIIVNSIDANGVGKKVGTLDLSDTTAGHFALQVCVRSHDWACNPPAHMRPISIGHAPALERRLHA